MKDLDPKLLELFEAEQREHLQTVRALLAAGAGKHTITELFRCVHTLKGAARAVGVGSTEQLAHRLETLFARVRDKSLGLDQRVIATIYRVLDSIEDVLSAVLGGGEEPDTSGVLGEIENLLGIAAVAAPLPPQLPAAAPAERPIDTIRVSTKHVDELVRSSSQVLAASSALLQAARQVDDLYQRIRALERESMRWRGAGKRRSLSTNFDFVNGQLRSLARQAREVNLAQQRSSWTLRQIGTQVYQDACRVRMTPAETVFDPFRKMVRHLAQSEGKEIEFHAGGLDVHVDRLVLQRLKDPIMHLLRNAIHHGIEPPGERTAAGKPPSGAVRLHLEKRGDRLNVTIEDDGRGIDFARVAEVAVNKGLLSREQAAAQSPLELARLILEPGFSTSQSVDHLAGRGMGLNVVQDHVARLHGEVTFPQRIGPGTSVVLAVPTNISTEHVVLVLSGQQTFAIPGSGISRLCRIAPGQIETFEGREVVRVDEKPVPVATLSTLLGLPEAAPRDESGKKKLLVLRTGKQTVALIVEDLIDEREALLLDLGLPDSMAGLSMGGIPLEDGSVAVVLNPPALLERFRRAGNVPAAIIEPVHERKAPKTILVVDDSITTRSLEKSILEAHGYVVRVAVDGVEALGQLRQEPAGLVIADVMMPRMDGFQLLEQIKNDSRLAHIPVIMVTSLEHERERGLALGADAYILKQKFDQRELLNLVRQILS